MLLLNQPDDSAIRLAVIWREPPRLLPLHPFSVVELCPTDLTQWRALRSELNYRQEARRMQHRFRKSPENYLAYLEEKLIKERLPT